MCEADLTVATLRNDNPAKRHSSACGLAGIFFSFSPKVQYHNSLRYDRWERDFPLAHIH
jgi:hypothetical protein